MPQSPQLLRIALAIEAGLILGFQVKGRGCLEILSLTLAAALGAASVLGAGDPNLPAWLGADFFVRPEAILISLAVVGLATLGALQTDWRRHVGLTLPFAALTGMLFGRGLPVFALVALVTGVAGEIARERLGR